MTDKELVERLREKRPCEHCQWRMNKEDPVVCGICYREVFG